MTPWRRRVGYVLGAVILVVGLAVSAFGDRLGQALTPDSDGCAGSSDIPTQSNTPETRRATLCLLNARRAEAGLDPLRPSATLARAARDHSEDMGARRFFAHRTPDGVEPAQRMVRAGYPRGGVTVGENLAWREEAKATPAEIVEGWMDGPGHRANILRPEFEEIGIGLAYEPPRPASGRVAVYTTNLGARGE